MGSHSGATITVIHRSLRISEVKVNERAEKDATIFASTTGGDPGVKKKKYPGVIVIGSTGSEARRLFDKQFNIDSDPGWQMRVQSKRRSALSCVA